MVKPVFITGDVPSATQVNDWFVNTSFIRKTADESVTSSTTFQNDDDLVLPVSANTVYEFTLVLRYDAASAGDLKTQIVLPAGASLRAYLSRLHPGAAVTSDASVLFVTESQSNSIGGLGTGFDLGAFFKGLVVMSTTAGNCQFQWAQDVSNATATRVWANSYMKLTRVA